MKISAKVQISALVLAILAVVLICIVCARTDQAEAARPEDPPEVTPTIRPPMPETTVPIFALESAGIFEDAEPEPEIVVLASAEPEIDDAELEMLACVIYTEAGGDACSDLCRVMVGDVVLNRVEDPRFPGTMEKVLTDERQYGEWHWTGIQWPERASSSDEAEAVERAYDTARYILEGHHSGIYGQGYIWEAEFPQGFDMIVLDGLYFGK